MSYRVEFASQVERHLKALGGRDRAIVFDAIRRQLVHEPTVPTRNRKQMRPNPLASWELRVGDLRIYYDVRDEPEPTVQILAVGVKKREQIWIGHTRINL